VWCAWSASLAMEWTNPSSPRSYGERSRRFAAGEGDLLSGAVVISGWWPGGFSRCQQQGKRQQ
jgi:hypothetical protein